MCVYVQPRRNRSAYTSLLSSLLARLLGAGSTLTHRLEHGPLDGRNALLEACWTRSRERSRPHKCHLNHLGIAQALLRVVVDGGAEAAGEKLAARLTLLALAACRGKACSLRRLDNRL